MTLPVSGVIYDVRKGEKIAKGNSFSIKVPLGYGQLFSILPKEVAAPKVTLPATVKPGAIVTCKCTTKGAVSKTVYRMEVMLPDGTTPAFYAQNTTFPTPEGSFAFQVPFNATQGKWSVTITHVASGTYSKHDFMVK